MGKQRMGLVQAVKGYALAHYGQDGWDYIVECWTDEEIAEEIKDCLSENGRYPRNASDCKTVPQPANRRVHLRQAKRG